MGTQLSPPLQPLEFLILSAEQAISQISDTSLCVMLTSASLSMQGDRLGQRRSSGVWCTL